MSRSLNERAKQRVERDFARAAEAGHDAYSLLRVPRGTSGTNHGVVAQCSCGWTATPRGRKVVAASAAYWHVLEVCHVLDERRRLDGIEWSQAPATPALRRGVSEETRRRHAEGAADLPHSARDAS